MERRGSAQGWELSKRMGSCGKTQELKEVRLNQSFLSTVNVM